MTNQFDCLYQLVLLKTLVKDVWYVSIVDDFVEILKRILDRISLRLDPPDIKQVELGLKDLISLEVLSMIFLKVINDALLTIYFFMRGANLLVSVFLVPHLPLTKIGLCLSNRLVNYLLLMLDLIDAQYVKALLEIGANGPLMRECPQVLVHLFIIL